MPNTPTLAKWQHARIRTIDLPSEHLRDIALAYHYDPKWVPDDDHLGTPEERQAWEDFMDYCVAAYLVRPKIEPHEVRALNERDRIQLFRRATHQDLGDELQFANASFRLRAAGIAVGGNGAGATNGTKRSRGDRV